MKNEFKIYVLSYASFSAEDGELFTDTLGLYDTEDKAIEAMEQNVQSDIEDGDDEDFWSINGNTADYVDDFANEYKSYKVKLVK